MTGPAPAADASDLCTHCGMCCDGTLFDRALAYPEELERIAAHGVPLVPGETLAFTMPCPRLDGACCTIYPDRFVTCRKFRCKLLRRLDAGEIDAAQGRETIATARGLVDTFAPDERTAAPRRRAFETTKGFAGVTDPAERMAMARKHLALVALDRYLNAHFRDDPKPGATEKA